MTSPNTPTPLIVIPQSDGVRTVELRPARAYKDELVIEVQRNSGITPYFIAARMQRSQAVALAHAILNYYGENQMPKIAPLMRLGKVSELQFTRITDNYNVFEFQQDDKIMVLYLDRMKSAALAMQPSYVILNERPVVDPQEEIQRLKQENEALRARLQRIADTLKPGGAL